MEIKDVYVTIHVNQLDEALPFYRELTGKSIDIRWEAPELELEFAVIGRFVLVAGSDEALAPVIAIRSILYVDSIKEFVSFFTEAGVEILKGPIENPVGTFIIVRHPDGRMLEYLEPRSIQGII